MTTALLRIFNGMRGRIGGPVTALSLLIAVAGSGPARAEPIPGIIDAKAAYPSELTLRPLTLPAGMLQVVVSGPSNLRTDFLGRPGGTAPGLDYGITDNLTVSVTPNTLCLEGCSEVLGKAVAAETSYSLFRAGGQQLAAYAGVSFSSTEVGDPARYFVPTEANFLSGETGVGYKLAAGQFAVIAGGGLGFGLTQRDLGNREVASISVEPMFQVTERLAAYVAATVVATTPPNGGFLGRGVIIPVGVGALYHVYRGAMLRGLDLGVSFGFGNLLGKYATTELRAGGIVGLFRF